MISPLGKVLANSVVEVVGRVEAENGDLANFVDREVDQVFRDGATLSFRSPTLCRNLVDNGHSHLLGVDDLAPEQGADAMQEASPEHPVSDFRHWIRDCYVALEVAPFDVSFDLVTPFVDGACRSAACEVLGC
jgi:hypothetical protein